MYKKKKKKSICVSYITTPSENFQFLLNIIKRNKEKIKTNKKKEMNQITTLARLKS